MSDKTYNGWTNYATWLVNLWIDNDPYLTEQFSNECCGLFGSWEEKDDVDWRLGDYIKEVMEEIIEEQGVEGFVLDLVNSAMSEVNWREIAGHYCDEELSQRESEESEE